MKVYTLDLDRPRELRFGFKSMRLIRQHFGNRTVGQLMSINVDEVPALAWAGLKWDDKNLTIEKVEALLDEAIPEKTKILEVITVVVNALADHMGVESKKAKAGGTVAGAEKTEEMKTESVKVEEVTEEKEQPTETIPSTRKQKRQL